jgi:hypothetical protein
MSALTLRDLSQGKGPPEVNPVNELWSADARYARRLEYGLIWRCLRCSTCVGLPLDPNVNTPGIRLCSGRVQVRLERKALAVTAASHLLLRVESNGS